MTELSPKIQILHEILDWDECEDGNTIMNPTHFISYTIDCLIM
jgi:hypothetical protein